MGDIFSWLKAKTNLSPAGCWEWQGTMHGVGYGSVPKWCGGPWCKFPDAMISDLRDEYSRGVQSAELQRKYRISETHFYRVIKGASRRPSEMQKNG